MIKLLQNSKGISMVEFLLNVAVLILLFALAFPAYMAFREKLAGPNGQTHQQAGLRENATP